MPKYDFTCMVCDKTIEIELPFTNSDAPLCEGCGHRMLKVYSAPGIHFKGSGWGGQ
jgi:putative FmdB family regulatory protein